MGWNTNGANYKAEYEASYAIFLGENVTPKTDVAPYEIWNNGNITCTAEVAITMSDGFHAKPGSEFHVRIAPVGYAACTDGKSAQDGTDYVGNENIDQNVIEGEFNSEKAVGTYLVAPNPTTGEQSFQIIGPDDLPLTVRLFDLSGKQIYWGRIEPNTTLYTNLLPGVYVILIDNGTTEQIEKIVIQ
ncbi:MAG: T9SS type A sorting domain-containing protein [Crocinitomicaceae bacterium]|nr:T9SS type A sorting domain-containing protein [Crocinitomicaceae bacterium]MBK6950484.1 T9SS type A sorting domain-containing protein [Crocinitomicaceae bacterium]